ncbi:MAG: GGDEF domain-containing protein [Mycobacterium sp.]|nr:GGDEF domain-containing protein [Mycobacterium sp.]
MDTLGTPSAAAEAPPAIRPNTGFSDADYVRGMERLLRAVQDLSLARSLAEVQRIVRTAARELTGCDGATFVLRDDDTCFYADEDAIAPLWKGNRFPMNICVSGWAMRNRDAAVIPDIYCDPRVPVEAYRPTFVKSLVMVPIRKMDPIGAIGNYWASQRHPSAQEISLLQALADSTSIALENVNVYAELEDRVRDRTAELEKAHEEVRALSVTDELTGLNNRRGFYPLAEAALHAARRHNRSCLLAFLDIDGLKRVNDEQGHDVGDALLADVAEILRTTLRRSDILARMGGDEFCILVAEPEGDPAMLRKRILDAFECFNQSHKRSYRLSASVGLVEVWPTEDYSLDQLLARADALMYEEKKTKPDSRRFA